MEKNQSTEIYCEQPKELCTHTAFYGSPFLNTTRIPNFNCYVGQYDYRFNFEFS
jgi:hypothetical protein